MSTYKVQLRKVAEVEIEVEATSVEEAEYQAIEQAQELTPGEWWEENIEAVETEIVSDEEGVDE